MADAVRDNADAMETAMEEDNDEAELSSDGSSDEEEGEAVSSEVIQQMEEIRKMLSANPYHYDSHLQLIALARSVGDLDAARKAREAMHDVFPLTEALWLEWLRDELPLADLDEALGDIRALFEKAVDDYIAPGVWLMYAQFAVQKMDKFEEGIAFPRNVFERAITASGLHASKGSLLWDAYREFEMAVLSSLQAMQPEGGTDEELMERIQAQYDVVENIFKRQLAVPLIGMQSTFKEYQEWCDEEVSEESLPTYTLAAKKLKELEQFERNLSADTPPSLDVYKEYIAHELKGKDLARISCVYMRALADHCLDVELWREYLKYLDSSLKIRDTVLHAHHQSIRNCPWSADMWVSYLRAMERLQCAHEEVVAKFEAALSGNFTEPKDYIKMWVVYCEYLQRRISDWSQTDSPGVKELMDTFKRARDNLKEYFGPSGDPEFVMARFQAQIEAGCRGNIERARQLWNEIIRGYSSKAEYQLQYLSLERCYGDESHCRSLLKRAVDSVQDHPDMVFGEYLSFERERGSLDSLVAAEERVEARRAQLRRRAEKEKQKDLDMAALRKQKGRRGRGGEERGDRGEVRTSSSTELHRKRRHHIYFQDDDDEEAPDVETAASLTTPTTVEQRSKPAAKKPRVEETSAMEDVVQPPVNEQGHTPKEPAAHAPSDARVDSATVFVSNLPFGTKTSEIQSLFVTCGDIVDVRTVRSGAKGKAKKPFAYAYVQFSTEAAVQKALLHDRVSFHGRQVYVSPCGGHEKKQGTESGPVPRFSEGRQRETVFVSNLPFSCEEDRVKSVFSKCGEVKQVRMVTFSKGRRKGIAYVEYLDEQSAQKAVEELDQFEIDERKINVAISNPPRKGRQGDKPVAMETAPSKTEPKKDMAPPSLIPSSVSRRPRINVGASGGKPVAGQGRSGGKEEREGSGEKKGLSNADFRKLFTSK